LIQQRDQGKFNIIAFGVDVATGKGFEIASQQEVQN